MKKISITYIFIAIVIIGLFGAVASAGYFYYQYRQLLTSNSAENDQKILDQILKDISKTIELPEETPTMATVSDISQLQEQPFFAKAQNGDRVLFFTESKKAILYRLETKKIIEFASINITQDDVDAIGTSASLQSSNTKAEPTPIAKTAQVSLYNGSGTPGVTTTFQSRLLQDFPELEVFERANANQLYDSTLIVDISGNNSEVVNQLAEKYQATVSSIPTDEQAPSSEILIILGKNIQ